MRPRVAPLSTGGLLALVVLDAWLLTAVLLDDGPEQQAAVAKVAWSPSLPPTFDGTLSSKPAAAYPKTLAHPIFHKSRAPFVAPPPPAPKPVALAAPAVPADPGIVLGGVATNGILKKAYVFTRGNVQGTWVGEGEVFAGWTVHSIHTVSIKLQQAHRTTELQLYEKR